MKSLHQSAQLAKTLARILQNRYAHFWIDELYSNSKTELVLRLKKDKASYGYIIFNFVADNLLVLFPRQINKRSRLAKDHFGLNNRAQISSISWIQNERVIELSLSNEASLFICFYGRRADVIFKQNDKLISFRNNPNALKLIKHVNSPEIDFQVDNWDLFWERNRFIPPMEFSTNYTVSKAQTYVNELGKMSLKSFDQQLLLSTDPISSEEQFIEIHEFNLNFLKRFTAERRRKEEASRKLKHQKNLNQRLSAAKNKLLGLERNNRFLQWADTIMSNLATLDPTQKKQNLMDWTSQKLISVPLNTEKSPIDNANKYYQKAKNTHKEIAFLKSKIKNLEKELKNPNIPNQRAVTVKQVVKPYYVFSFEGFEIRVGKSAEKNDELIKLHSHKNDLWLHAKDVPGSHVLIRNPNNHSIGNALLEFAASLAAKYSKAKGQTLAAVSYTPRKYVRKNKKMLPGQVRLEKEETILIKPAD